MNCWISLIERNAVLSILIADVAQPVRRFVKSFIPTDPLPTRTGASHRMTQTVWIKINILQSDCLGADVTAAEWVLFVTTNRPPESVPNLDSTWLRKDYTCDSAPLSWPSQNHTPDAPSKNCRGGIKTHSC